MFSFASSSSSGQYTGIKFGKVDVDECPEASEACGISAMPTFQMFVNGKKVDELMGASESKLVVCLAVILFF